MICFGLCVLAPNRPQDSEGGMGMRGGLAGHAESLRSCGEALGACVGMAARHHANRGDGRAQQRGWDVGTQTSVSLDDLGECEGSADAW